MTGQRIGYVRVSTLDQNEERLEGQVLDRIFTEKASGRDTPRPKAAEAAAWTPRKQGNGRVPDIYIK